MKNNRQVTNVLIIAGVLLCAIVATIIIGLNLPEQTDYIQGEAEMTDYRISGKVPARIAELRVGEGDHMRRGDTLVILEAPDIAAKLAQANAALSAAEAMEEKARNGSRQEQIQAAYETWQKAKAASEVAEKTYGRVSRLFDEGVVAEQKRDEALAQRDAMLATERAAKSQYDMAVNGAREEDKQAAIAQRRRALAAVSEVTSYVEETVLLATVDGTVTEIFPEVGELVGTGAPIMNVVSDDVWFTFNIREDLLPGISVGKEVRVYVPALDATVAGRVTLMKDVGSFATWKATKALDQFDLKTFEVQVRPLRLSDTEGIRAAMSAILIR